MAPFASCSSSILLRLTAGAIITQIQSLNFPSSLKPFLFNPF
jgi:hypothetical protein